MKPVIHRGKTNANGIRFAIVASRWNDLLTSRLVEGAVDALESAGASEADVEIFMVPGAFELPLAAKKAAFSGRFDAVIAIGVVIRGETPHFDYVAGEAAKGVATVALDAGIPVMFGVVTADTVEQAVNRSGLKSGNKGYEAAMAAIEMADLCRTMAENDQKGKGKAFPHVV